jgi:hypothetical protein
MEITSGKEAASNVSSYFRGRSTWEVTSGLILNHLLALEDKIKQLFSSLAVDEYDWVRNPYAVSPDATTNLPMEKQELAELQSDRTLQLKYGELSLPKFWILAKGEQ